MTSDNHVTGLLPCPFCGDRANEPAYLGFGDWHVDCRSCPASVDAVGPDEAIAAWNTRQPFTSEQASVHSPQSSEAVERATGRLIAFVQHPKWSEDAVEPEDNPDWRAGYEAAQDNLREELKPWWPLGGPLRITALSRTDDRLREALEAVRERLDWGGHTDDQPDCPSCALYALVCTALQHPAKGEGE